MGKFRDTLKKVETVSKHFDLVKTGKFRDTLTKVKTVCKHFGLLKTVI